VYRLFLARRYMLARPVSYLAMLAIGVAVGALIVVISVMNGFLDKTREIVRGTTADIIVLPLQDPVRGDVAGRDEFERIVGGQAGVAGACSRLVRPAVIKVPGAPSGILNDSMYAGLSQVLVLGIDPDAEMRVTDLSNYLTAVENPALAVEDPQRPFTLNRRLITDSALRNFNPDRILLGESRMKALHLVRGQAVQMVTVPEGEDLSGTDNRAAITTKTFVIAGAFRTGHHEFDMGNVFITRDAFREWTGTKQELSEMYVQAQPGTSLEMLRDRLGLVLEHAGHRAEVETWKDRHKVYLGAVENERNILGFVLALFVLLTCTITFSMLTMMVQEKIRDIGILSAMGAPSSGIGSVFALCGVYISGLGGLFGLGAGTLVALHVNDVKNWIEATFHIQIFRRDVYAFFDVPSDVNHELDIAIVLITAVFSVLICLLPALRAASLDPVEALRHE
jgi:lipoprotein-releasing system permease protein